MRFPCLRRDQTAYGDQLAVFLPRQLQLHDGATAHLSGGTGRPLLTFLSKFSGHIIRLATYYLSFANTIIKPDYASRLQASAWLDLYLHTNVRRLMAAGL